MELLIKHLVVKVPPGIRHRSRRPPAEAGLGLRRSRSAWRPRLRAADHPVRGQGRRCPPPPVDPDPVVYWNAELKLAGASLDTGLVWTDVHGAVASVGRYDGTHLGAVLGNAWFDHATIAKQPVTSAK